MWGTQPLRATPGRSLGPELQRLPGYYHLHISRRNLVSLVSSFSFYRDVYYETASMHSVYRTTAGRILALHCWLANGLAFCLAQTLKTRTHIITIENLFFFLLSFLLLRRKWKTWVGGGMGNQSRQYDDGMTRFRDKEPTLYVRTTTYLIIFLCRLRKEV
ncbi:hypothetical protein B0J18DRAFT_160362 [Chaetomium sp. MPI-SDFR-AT-0129]|nr:hypothetical protein B0J18DRAFT_160362 [Chaetomium sp. MPI-SDFR-AT-0129]